jgi:hypothetical protein
MQIAHRVRVPRGPSRPPLLLPKQSAFDNPGVLFIV